MNTQSYLKISFSLVSLLTIFGCNQDPYANIGELTPKRTLADMVAGYTINGPSMIECTESLECGALVSVSVPSPGTAKIQVLGLPTGAIFDSTTGKFSYTPDYDVVDTINDPTLTVKTTPLRFVVTSSLDQSFAYDRIITLVVKNKQRPTQVVVAASAEVSEGQTLTQEVNIVNPDLPHGPFYLNIENGPAGVQVIQDPSKESHFTLKFTPDASFVNNGDVSDGTDFYKTVSLNIRVNSPNSESALGSTVWKVKDVRVAPVIVAPDTITQGLNANFVIGAIDYNEEESPKILLDTQQVQYGTLSTQVINQAAKNGKGLPATLMMVSWNNIPSWEDGKTTSIHYSVCTHGVKGKFAECVAKETKITIRTGSSELTSNFSPTDLSDNLSEVILSIAKGNN